MHHACMRRFADLFQALDASTATSAKLAALRAYYAVAPGDDAAWATYFLAGGKPRQLVPTAVLRELACRRAGIDDWLFDECYQVVGDLAETIAHVLPPAAAATDLGLAHWVEQRLLPLRGLPPETQAAEVLAHWDALDATGRFLYVKLIGGGFRVGVSKLLVQRALAEHAVLDPKLLAQRMMGWTDARSTPTAERFAALLGPASGAAQEGGQPYPFYLAHALQRPLEEFDSALGPVTDWQVEWKVDGIRAQLVRRSGQLWIWSRGEELVTERFPDVVAALQGLPDGTVLDGELLVWPAGAAQPASFAQLQPRINRKLLTKKLLAEAPVAFLAYDLLESEGQDRRGEPQTQRRARLEALAAAPGLAGALRVSPLLQADSWPAYAALRESARERGYEGFMLKAAAGRYGSGRTRADGSWWKWKTEPLSVDAVLIYAQAGHGRRASVYTDYTFAVWSRPPASPEEAQAVVEAIAARRPAVPGELQLLPFAKAYSGLSDEEFKAVDRVIRATTLEKFGPVRSVRPTLVFEIGFEGIQTSPRHKSGIAVRFPRMLRPRPDKPLHEADSLGTLQALLAPCHAAVT
jgi:DNA ligase-1